MTDLAADDIDFPGAGPAPSHQAASGSATRGHLLGQSTAFCVGAVVGPTMALGHGQPSGATLKTIVVSLQIRVDLATGEAECVCGIPVAYDAISPYVVRALIAFEDRAVRRH